MTKIKVTDLKQDGATVSFDKDMALIASLKKTFPKARWNPTTRVWGIPGKLAFKRATQWAAKIEVDAIEVEAQAEKIRRDAEFEGRLHEVDPAVALAARKGEFKSTAISVVGATATYVMGECAWKSPKPSTLC